MEEAALLTKSSDILAAYIPWILGHPSYEWLMGDGSIADSRHVPGSYFSRTLSVVDIKQIDNG